VKLFNTNITYLLFYSYINLLICPVNHLPRGKHTSPVCGHFISACTIFVDTFSICVKFLHTANMMNTMTNMFMVFKMINIYWFVSNEKTHSEEPSSSYQTIIK
jgi:hypothetical protein